MSISAQPTPVRTTRLARSVRLLLALALLVAVFVGGGARPADAATAKPTLKVASTTSTTATVTWSKVKKAAGYRVKYSSSSKMSHPTYVRTKSTKVALSGLKAETTYYVKVRATKKSGKALSGYSKVVEVATDVAGSTGGSTTPPASGGSADLRVASYNITCAACFDGQTDELPWSGRRDTVVAAIKAQDLDVIGIQEAGQGWLKDANGDKIDLSQFEDLRNRLGGHWTLTNDKRNNCVRAKSPSSCEYKDQGASDGTRILFDSSRVQMIASGSKLLPNVAGANDRYVAWAQLRQLSTGRAFMFGSIHTEHTKDKSGSTAYFDMRRKQAEVAVATLAAHNPDHLPSFLVGDYNSSRFPHDYSPTNAPYDAVVKAGYVDPIGGAWRTTKTAPGALVEKRINTWISSFNGFGRQLARHDGWINGSYIDYIMVTPGTRVKEFETVAKVDDQDRLVGIIPSDHNMIRATVVLPAKAQA